MHKLHKGTMISSGRRRNNTTGGHSANEKQESNTSIRSSATMLPSKHGSSVNHLTKQRLLPHRRNLLLCSNKIIQTILAALFLGSVVLINLQYTPNTNYDQNLSIRMSQQPEKRGLESVALPHYSPTETNLIDPNDYIFARNLSRFDAAPIIVPEYKLAFFSVPKVACTTFKFLFRRMSGAQRWDSQDFKLILPHNPKYNGLKYLWDFPLEEATEIMTSPEWTRAIFVRDPKQRFLSAFLDKSIGDDGWHVLKSCCPEALECQGIPPNRKEVHELLDMCHLDAWDSRNNKIVPQWNLEIPCCEETMKCRQKTDTMEGFLETIQTCHDEHWGMYHHYVPSWYAV